MTDQQTSRTNITEALRHFDNADDAIRWLIDDHSKQELADLVVAALAAEPRSDAVTAPDEPSTEADDVLRHIKRHAELAYEKSQYGDYIESDILEVIHAVEDALAPWVRR